MEATESMLELAVTLGAQAHDQVAEAVAVGEYPVMASHCACCGNIGRPMGWWLQLFACQAAPLLTFSFLAQAFKCTEL